MTNISGGLQEVTREDNLNIGTTSTIISNPRLSEPERKVIVVRNTSPNATDTITISFGNMKVAEAGKGIILKQNESFVDASSEGYTSYQGQVNGICATATGIVAIFER